MVAGLWGQTLGESWPSEPTYSYASIDFWCQLVAALLSGELDDLLQWLCRDDSTINVAIIAITIIIILKYFYYFIIV